MPTSRDRKAVSRRPRRSHDVADQTRRRLARSLTRELHEALFARFEREYRAGKRPEIIKYLEQAGDDRVVCLRELVKLDIEYQWKLGQEAIVEDYFEQFPELATASQAIDDLVEEELIVRQRLGKLPTRSELRCRFPEDSARLVALLEALPKSTRSGRSAISTELDTMASLSTMSGGGFTRIVVISAENRGFVDLGSLTEITGGATLIWADGVGSIASDGLVWGLVTGFTPDDHQHR